MTTTLFYSLFTFNIMVRICTKYSIDYYIKKKYYIVTFTA